MEPPQEQKRLALPKKSTRKYILLPRRCADSTRSACSALSDSQCAIIFYNFEKWTGVKCQEKIDSAWKQNPVLDYELS
jgi:hypothetical protein